MEQDGCFPYSSGCSDLDIIVIIDARQDFFDLLLPGKEILSPGRVAHDILHDYKIIVKFNDKIFIVKIFD
jgi:hypothetical protein